MLKKLAEVLKGAGFDAVVNEWGNLLVNGVQFRTELTKRDDILEFLGSKFLIYGDGSFNIQKAIGLVLMELPKRMAALNASKIVEELATGKYEFITHARMHPVTPGVYLMPVDGEVYVCRACTTKEQVQEALAK